jgi:hypothetical protein
MWFKILVSLVLIALLANFGFSLYSLVLQVQTKDTVKDSWGWIILRVLGVLGSLNVLRVLWIHTR